MLMVTHQMVALCSRDKGHLSVSTLTKQMHIQLCVQSMQFYMHCQYTKVMNSFLYNKGGREGGIEGGREGGREGGMQNLI